MNVLADSNQFNTILFLVAVTTATYAIWMLSKSFSNYRNGGISLHNLVMNGISLAVVPALAAGVWISYQSHPEKIIQSVFLTYPLGALYCAPIYMFAPISDTESGMTMKEQLLRGLTFLALWPYFLYRYVNDNDLLK